MCSLVNLSILNQVGLARNNPKINQQVNKHTSALNALTPTQTRSRQALTSLLIYETMNPSYFFPRIRAKGHRMQYEKNRNREVKKKLRKKKKMKMWRTIDFRGVPGYMHAARQHAGTRRICFREVNG